MSSNPMAGWSRALLIKALDNAEDAAATNLRAALQFEALLDRALMALQETRSSRLLAANIKRSKKRLENGQRAHAMRRDGKTIAEIAVALDVTPRWVEKLLEPPK